ncbi:hypothetical protein GZL_05955 [Streptomyces sp. 769]|nr:hypothetical protein GZL_05955 [Streptomyces sp. 769]
MPPQRDAPPPTNDTPVDDTARADAHVGDTTPTPPVEGPR